MSEIISMSAVALRDAVTAKRLKAREVAEAFLERAQAVEPKVNSFLRLEPEIILREADGLDRRLAAGELDECTLAGVPVAVKDVIVTRGVPTTCGSQILKGYRPPYDATVVERLKRQGALIFGKTNCDEFAMGSSTENSSYGPTRNPWDLERVPGGSSGGSGACVAALEAPLSLGTDTGGSIRQPAAFCGVAGLKPTYGRVSRYGLVAFASSLDQIGPFARSAADVALALQTLAGWDPRDGTSSERPVEDYPKLIEKDLRGLRVGVPKEWFGAGLDPRIRDAVQSAIAKLGELGCETLEVSLPNSEFAIATYYIIATAEASSNLARYDGVKYGHRTASPADLRSMYRSTRSEGFGEEVKRRIMLGTYVLSAGYYDAYYLKAGKVRTLIRRDYEEAFTRADVLVGPTTPSLPFKLGEKTADPLEMYLSDIFTVTANLAGIPGLSVPCGFSEEGLPIGLQILGPHFAEAKLLQVAHALEQALRISGPALQV